jgi:SAM-dependent methyltransferase
MFSTRHEQLVFPTMSFAAFPLHEAFQFRGHTMDKQEFERTFQIESNYWWNLGRFHIIESLIQRYIQPNPNEPMADLGCGTGATTRWLQKFGNVRGVDASALALKYCRKRGLHNLLNSKLEKLKLPSNSQEVVFALDILEHIRDDSKAIQEMFRVLKPGHKCLVVSPAYQWLWSEHDQVCQHKRRYTLSEMRHKLESAGFKMVRSSYCILFPLLPLLLLLKFRSYFKSDRNIMQSIVKLPNFLNQCLVWLLSLENFLLYFLNLPFGVSIICLAEKPLTSKFKNHPEHV